MTFITRKDTEAIKSIHAIEDAANALRSHIPSLGDRLEKLERIISDTYEVFGRDFGHLDLPVAVEVCRAADRRAIEAECRVPEGYVLVPLPRFWNKQQSDAWHRAIPDVYAAFDALAEAAATQPEKADPKAGHERANGNAVLVPCDKLAQMKERIAELEATIEAQRTLYANVVKVANRNDELEAALRDKQ